MDSLAQDVGTVRAHERCGLDAVPARIQACARLRFSADSIDAGVGAAATGHFHYPLVDILFHKIESFRAGRTGESQPFRHGVDRDNALGARQECTPNGELSHWAAAPYRNGFAAF